MYTGYENWTISEITRGLEEMNTPLARELINRLNPNSEDEKNLEGRIEYLEEELESTRDELDDVLAQNTELEEELENIKTDLGR